MYFFAIPFRALARHRLRTALTVTGIAVGVGALVSLVGLSRGADRSYVETVFDRGTHLMAFRKGALDFMTPACEESRALDLMRSRGVVDTSAEYVTGVDIEDEVTGQTQIIVITSWPPDSYLWETLKFDTGGVPSGKPDGLFPIALGRTWADAFGKSVGDIVHVLGHPCRITGIVGSAGAGNRRMAFMPLDGLQKITLQPGKITNINLRVTDADDGVALDALVERLRAEFTDLEFYPTQDLAANNHGLGFLRALTWATSTIALCVSFVVILNTLLMSVTSRFREFGILAATGWSPERIGALIILEGFLLCGIGALCGILLGRVALFFVSRSQIILAIETGFSTTLSLWVLLATCFLGLLGSFYPAWLAARQKPADVLARP